MSHQMPLLWPWFVWSYRKRKKEGCFIENSIKEIKAFVRNWSDASPQIISPLMEAMDLMNYTHSTGDGELK